MFVIKLTYHKPLSVMDELRPAHLEFLDKYYAKNIFLISGRQNPPIGGVILAHNIEKEKLEEILKQDPFYQEQAAIFEVTEFVPSKFHPQLKDLIK